MATAAIAESPESAESSESADSPEDRRARLQLVADRVAPLALAHQRTLPLLPAVSDLFVGGSLQRGLTVAVDGIGATSMALVLAAGPSQAGSWTALVGTEELGLGAVAEAGIALERLLVVGPVDASTNAGVVAALVGAVDVVLVGSGLRFRPADLRRLSARLRESGSVLIQIGSPQIGSDRAAGVPESAESTGQRRAVDVGIRVTAAQWSGLGSGHGRLRSRKVEVLAQGRGAATRARVASLLLPGPDGAPQSPVPVGPDGAPQCVGVSVGSDGAPQRSGCGGGVTVGSDGASQCVGVPVGSDGASQRVGVPQRPVVAAV